MKFLPASTAALWFLACTAALAAPPAVPEASAPLSKGEIKAMRDFKLLDFNGDGKISRTEVMLFPRLSAAFDEADTNHDNYLSFDEVRAFAVRYRAERDRQRAAQKTLEGNETQNGQSGSEGQKAASASEAPKATMPPSAQPPHKVPSTQP